MLGYVKKLFNRFVNMSFYKATVIYVVIMVGTLSVHIYSHFAKSTNLAFIVSTIIFVAYSFYYTAKVFLTKDI
jgi:hypothetical protein